jgi:hypothetical protein
VTQTVLEVGLVGYSSIARMLEQNIGVNAVKMLNEQIQ